MDTQYKLGYGSWCGVSSLHADYKSACTSINKYVQATSASVTKSFSVPTMNSYYLPKSGADNTAKSLIRLGYGTCAFNGQISFQLTKNMLDFLLPKNEGGKYAGIFSPLNLFDVLFFDGKQRCRIGNCMWTNISINCQPGALVTASISFQSNNNFKQNLQIDTTDGGSQYDPDNFELIPYWQTGDDDMIQFQLSFERNVIPVYLNNDYVTPSYLRPGLINLNLSATYLEQQTDFPDISIKIGSKKITFNKLMLQNHVYNISNMQSQGEKTYQWNAISLNQTQPIFVIA